MLPVFALISLIPALFDVLNPNTIFILQKIAYSTPITKSMNNGDNVWKAGFRVGEMVGNVDN